jgi:aminoglycoside phosphotransferase (APT) family kinase protein
VKLLAEGRASEIYALGDGHVLRRFKVGGDPEREATVMEHARRHGFPVPAVVDVRRDGLVLEQIDGRAMADDLRRLSRWPAHAKLLASLHERLHAIDAPTPLGDGTLLHMDFHPANVLIDARGAWVIDWTNARAGAPALDVAMTWVLLTTSGGSAGARTFARLFLRHVDRAAARAALPEAAALRLADRNVREDERAALRSLLARSGRPRSLA